MVGTFSHNGRSEDAQVCSGHIDIRRVTFIGSAVGHRRPPESNIPCGCDGSKAESFISVVADIPGDQSCPCPVVHGDGPCGGKNIDRVSTNNRDITFGGLGNRISSDDAEVATGATYRGFQNNVGLVALCLK